MLLEEEAGAEAEGVDDETVPIAVSYRRCLYVHTVILCLQLRAFLNGLKLASLGLAYGYPIRQSKFPLLCTTFRELFFFASDPFDFLACLGLNVPGWRCLELGENPTKKGPRNRADSTTARLNSSHYVLSPDTSLLTTP